VTFDITIIIQTIVRANPRVLAVVTSDIRVSIDYQNVIYIISVLRVRVVR
jgi:hypothetical protein